MYDVEMQMMSQEFFDCWQAAATHLEKQAGDCSLSWLRAHPYPPYTEHLSFRTDNQLFFVRIEDIEGQMESPGTLDGLVAVAEGNRGHACIMPMRKIPGSEEWTPVSVGWGLTDASTGNPVDPLSLITDEKIEMTSWELHDMAVQVVREYLEKKGYQLMSWQGNPEIDPSIWFVGESKGPEYVVVRATRYPEDHAMIPENLKEIETRCSAISGTGYFASVALANSEQKFDSPDEEPIPLWRGCSMYINFPGLE